MTSSNSVSHDASATACSHETGALRASPKGHAHRDGRRHFGAARDTREITQEERDENQRLIVRKLLGCRRVDGLTSNGQAGKEIFAVQGEKSCSANHAGGAKFSPSAEHEFTYGRHPLLRRDPLQW